MTQGSEILQGTRDEFSGAELTTDILIGVPAALVGGATGNAATSQIKKAGSNQIQKSMQNTATKEYKNVIKTALQKQYTGLGNRQVNKIANQTIKTIHQGAKKEIEAVRVSIQTGVVVGTEAVIQVGSGKVDEKSWK